MRRPASCFPIPVFVCLLAAAPAVAQIPPDEAWRAVETEHFRVTFPEHLEALGRRAGDLAERAHRELTAQFREGPSGRIDIVLSDHVDVSNGFATIWPSNRIVLYARPPADHLALAYFDDWLELLITHELAHVFHLDYGGAVGRVFRALLGRAPLPFSFPGAFVPGWVTEGLATWYESALTDAGRVHGTFHEMVLRTAMLEGRFERIGQTGGNSPQWPGGIRRYAYGSLFFDYLLDKHGVDGMAAFVEAVVRPTAQLRLAPLNAAGRRAFGASLSSEWDAWTNEMRGRLSRLDGELAAFGPISESEALTRNARYGLHPMASPDGSALVYLRSDGRSYPRLVRMPPGGGDPSTVTRTNNRTPFDVLPGGQVVFAQRDYSDRYRVFSDLYVATLAGRVRRVTEGARLTAPSAGPEGAWAVAVAEGGGTNGLARVDLLEGSIRTLVAPAAGTYWAYPAVSPDGRRIAASRWTDRRHDVVILDMDGRVVHEVTRDRALDLAPDWSADGRYLVWSSDRSGIPNILGAEIDLHTGAAGPPVMLTNVRTGAAFPSIDPAGEWLYFSGYHVGRLGGGAGPVRAGCRPTGACAGGALRRVRGCGARRRRHSSALGRSRRSGAKLRGHGAARHRRHGHVGPWRYDTARRWRDGDDGVPRPGEPGPRLLAAVDPVSAVLVAGDPGAFGDREDDDRGCRGTAYRDPRLRGRRPHLRGRSRRPAFLRYRGPGLHVGRPGGGRRLLRVSGSGESDHRRDRLAGLGRRRSPGCAARRRARRGFRRPSSSWSANGGWPRRSGCADRERACRRRSGSRPGWSGATGRCWTMRYG